MRYKRKDFDLRISSLPTLYGEKIVIRLLEKNPVFKSLKAIGFSERNYELFAPLIKRPYGMLLCCCPTGIGAPWRPTSRRSTGACADGF